MVTVEVNTIAVTLHLDTRADVTYITEKNFYSLKGTSYLQQKKQSSGVIWGMAWDQLWLFHCHHLLKPKEH